MATKPTTAQRLKHRPGKGSKSRPFRSLNDAMNRRVMVWTCKSCGLWCYVKPKICSVCGGEKFHYFASKAEATRFAELDLAQTLGQITELETQVNFPCYVVGDSGEEYLVTTYRADFVYIENGKKVVEDVKANSSDYGITKVFEIKRKLVKALYNIDIRITKRG